MDCNTFEVVKVRQEEHLFRLAKQKELDYLRKKWMKKMETLKASIAKNVLPRHEARKKKAFALDCEMVEVRIPGSMKDIRKAASVGVVDSDQQVVYFTHISQEYPICNYFTSIHGITEQHLREAPPLEKVRRELYQILKDNILVGHDVKHDLKALEMQHPFPHQRDMQAFFRRNLPCGELKSNLKLMASVHLNQEIQGTSHNPVEDAAATMHLYKLYEDLVDPQAMDTMTPPRISLTTNLTNSAWQQQSSGSQFPK